MRTHPRPATSAGPAADPAGSAAGASTVADRRVLAVVAVFLVAVTVLQRFTIPVGPQLSVAVPVVLLGLGYLLWHGDAVENTPAVRTFVVAMAVCLIAAGTVMVTERSGVLTSLLYLPVIWSAFAIRLHPHRHHLYPRVLDLFEKFMLVFAVLGLLQTLTQFAGVWTYRDYLLDVVPEAFLFGGYNTSYPIEYGSPVIKANGFVFLEPSIYAQFLALALLSSLVRRTAAVRPVVLGLALIGTISGTGLLFASFGVLVLMLRRGGWWAVRIVVAGVLAAVGALLSPLGEIFLKRSTETSGTNSSGNLRFVAPYQEILDAWGADPAAALLGKGAGYADELMGEIYRLTGLPINFSGLAKLVFEYGLPAAALFCAFVVLALLHRSPAPTLALSGVFASAFLTGSLLQPQVLYVLVPTCSLFAGHRFEQVLDAAARRGRAARREDADARPGGVGITVPAADPTGGTRRA
ncbi:hypothetical protein MO973_29300 [Paenibacillus sp. TRM 82003]|uniref:hypothetical protein n=1 Tax=Kineococcus sp. TRM81007 TaxID=2925831 RepID=UPI001F598D12|nr:hypothetical protein [Kineococcus sp. TRM81007]MCI2238920.1 hypothetical protein [Kineococcus sp. TRM81007]MCI3924327.1 hypothetical protein [Paenibacillus sp. TRM 82003]